MLPYMLSVSEKQTARVSSSYLPSGILPDPPPPGISEAPPRTHGTMA